MFVSSCGLNWPNWRFSFNHDRRFLVEFWWRLNKIWSEDKCGCVYAVQGDSMRGSAVRGLHTRGLTQSTHGLQMRNCQTVSISPISITLSFSLFSSTALIGFPLSRPRFLDFPPSDEVNFWWSAWGFTQPWNINQLPVRIQAGKERRKKYTY